MATKKSAAKPVLNKSQKTIATDEMITALASSVNQHFSKSVSQSAYVLGHEVTPADLTDWVSTGSTLLNIAIANKPEGGFAVGRIHELLGMEGTGKSLIAAHALADTQQKGGVAVLIDTENAISKDFLIALGVDINRLLYIPLNLIEDCFEAIETIITKVRETDADRLVTIVLDSVAATTTKVESDSDYDKDGFSTTKAIIMSKALRKITDKIAKQRVCVIATNQLREKVGVMFGDKTTTSGGKSLQFYASSRLRAKSVGQIKQTVNGISHVIGIETEVIVKKNRMGPPHRSVTFPIYFDSGIDDINSWLTHLITFKRVVKEGKDSYKLKGTDIVFKSKDWVSMIQTDAKFKETILQQVADTIIMKYKIERDTVDPDTVQKVETDE